MLQSCEHLPHLFQRCDYSQLEHRRAGTSCGGVGINGRKAATSIVAGAVMWQINSCYQLSATWEEGLIRTCRIPRVVARRSRDVHTSKTYYIYWNSVRLDRGLQIALVDGILRAVFSAAVFWLQENVMEEFNRSRSEMTATRARSSCTFSDQ